MGYPMTYPRVVMRNGLDGDYANSGVVTGNDGRDAARRMLAGDLRRLELDARDDYHVARFAKLSGVSKPKVRLILDALFTDFGQLQTPWLAKPCWPEVSE